MVSPKLSIAPALKIGLTVQLTLVLEESVHPEPVDVLCDSMMLVPVTAAKLGKLVPHNDQLVPLFVEKRYSSCEDTAPLVPAVVTDMVNVVPAHTVASVGTFTITGPTETRLIVIEVVFPLVIVETHPFVR